MCRVSVGCSMPNVERHPHCDWTARVGVQRLTHTLQGSPQSAASPQEGRSLRWCCLQPVRKSHSPLDLLRSAYQQAAFARQCRAGVVHVTTDREKATACVRMRCACLHLHLMTFERSAAVKLLRVHCPRHLDFLTCTSANADLTSRSTA